MTMLSLVVGVCMCVCVRAVLVYDIVCVCQATRALGRPPFHGRHRHKEESRTDARA